MASLLQAASFYRSLQDEVTRADGEVTEDIIQALDEYEDSIHNKVDAIAGLMSDDEMWAARYQKDIEELAEMKRKREASIERWKGYLKLCLEQAGLERAGHRYPWVIRDNAIPKFTWTDHTKPIPEAFRNVKPAIIELDTRLCARVYKESEGMLPAGIDIARGKHVQPAYRKPKKGTTDGTGPGQMDY
jgi:hypothetical protein